MSNRHQRRAQLAQAKVKANQPQAHCHKQIREVAIEAAGCLYQDLMADDLMYKAWKEKNPGLDGPGLERRFVEQTWGRCLPFARATLAQLLTTAIDEKLKEEILEVLILDNTLVRGRGKVDALVPGLAHQAGV